MILQVAPFASRQTGGARVVLYGTWMVCAVLAWDMAVALAMILVGMMTLVTLVHQWLLKRSYHVSR